MGECRVKWFAFVACTWASMPGAALIGGSLGASKYALFCISHTKGF